MPGFPYSWALRVARCSRRVVQNAVSEGDAPGALALSNVVIVVRASSEKPGLAIVGNPVPRADHDLSAQALSTGVYHLCFTQREESPVLSGQQRTPIPGLDQTPLLQHVNDICAPNGEEPMGYD
jgi:hypothetical protein